MLASENASSSTGFHESESYAVIIHLREATEVIQLGVCIHFLSDEGQALFDAFICFRQGHQAVAQRGAIRLSANLNICFNGGGRGDGSDSAQKAEE